MFECRHSGKTNQHKCSQRDTFTLCMPKLRAFFLCDLSSIYACMRCELVSSTLSADLNLDLAKRD